MTKATKSEIRRAIAGLQRLAELLGQRRAQLAREAGLSEQQWRVLEGIAAPGFLPSLFARQRESTPAAVSKLLRQLLERGLVSVSISPSDARQREYRVTPRGRRTLTRIAEAREEAVHAVWSSLAAEDLARFADVAETLVARLEQHATARSRARV